MESMYVPVFLSHPVYYKIRVSKAIFQLGMNKKHLKSNRSNTQNVLKATLCLSDENVQSLATFLPFNIT